MIGEFMNGLLKFREGKGSCRRSLRGLQSESERQITAKKVVQKKGVV